MAKVIVLYGVFLWLVLGFCDYAGGGVVEREVVNSAREISKMGRELDVDFQATTSLRPKRRSLFIYWTPYRRTDLFIKASSNKEFLATSWSSIPLRSNRNDDEDKRGELQAIFRKEIGTREATGKNDGERIETYLKVTGLGPGYAYCSAFVSFCFAEAGYSEPRTPWSPALFPKNRIVYPLSPKALAKDLYPLDKQQESTESNAHTPKPGDVFGLYFANLKRIAHVGFVDEWGEKWAVTVEANTNLAGSNEGDGVYRKRRLKSSIYQVADWVSGQERVTK